MKISYPRTKIAPVLLHALLLLLPFLAAAQKDSIDFENAMSWNEVKTKAQRENKFIFVDCYATWCGPCKAMDKIVYTNPTVGKFADSRFISVKLQFDTTAGDNDQVKKWHAVAKQFSVDYSVGAFPTYLFFSPDGAAVHKDIGQKSPVDFVKVMQDALNPSKQFFTSLLLFRSKNLPYDQMPNFIKTADQIGEKNIAREVAGRYFRGYLFDSGDSLYTQENLRLLFVYFENLTSKDKIFVNLLKDEKRIDKLAGFEGYSADLVKKIIRKEEIDPVIARAKSSGKSSPEWESLEKKIKKKYNKGISDDLILQSKLRWYRDTKQYDTYAHYVVENVEKQNPASVKVDFNGILFLNNSAWNIFQYSKDTSEIAKAIKWVDHILAVDSNFQIQDTKANLLYKYGRKAEAIELEEKVLQTVVETKMVQRYIDQTRKTIEKMKAGEPTWN